MKLLKNTLAVSLLAGLSAMGVSANAALYEIDSHHTNARFTVDHFGTSTNAGAFYELTGVIDYSPEQQKGYVGIKIPIASLDTGIEPFNKHLKSADFFDVEKYPTAYFQSTDWTFDGNKVTEVKGNLTLLNQTHPVTLTATKFNCYNSPILNAKSCGGDFEATIDRRKWGMDKFTDGGMMSEVKLTIQVEATPKK